MCVDLAGNQLIGHRWVSLLDSPLIAMSMLPTASLSLDDCSFVVSYFDFFLERECVCARWGEGRGRESGWGNLTLAPHPAQRLTWGFVAPPWDRDLSWNQKSGLSHPGISVVSFWIGKHEPSQPPTLFLFLNVVLAVLGPQHFHMCVRIGPSTCRTWIGCAGSEDQCGERCCLNNTRFSGPWMRDHFSFLRSSLICLSNGFVVFRVQVLYFVCVCVVNEIIFLISL